jgi:hypothetical protein
MPRNNPDAPPVSGRPIIRLAVGIFHLGQQYELILDYLSEVAYALSRGDLSEIQSVWRTTCDNALALCLTSDSTINRYISQDVAQGLLPSVVTFPASPTPGQAAPPALNGMLCGVLEKSALLKGQHGRGRTLVGALPATFQDTANQYHLSTAGRAALAGFAAQLLVTLESPALPAYNLCISTRPVAPSMLVTRAAAVSLITTRVLLGTCRRRQEGRGI